MPNHLNTQKSPYLLQHAENPVNWYPWCDDAFAEAKKQEKPVFLSIGYSTCHWCHVMAHESFEDTEVADILNRFFISVKVDREERPDIDAVYMSACQAMTGSGGWPLTVLMTPGQKPFFAGTYFPKHSRYGTVGLCELLLQVKELWSSQRERLIRTGNEMTAWLQSPQKPSGAAPSPELVHQGASALFQSYDSRWGGFGQAPKFPAPHNLMFLFRYGKLEREPKALLMAEETLLHMARGGIYDHVGGGFSRYSTDEKWLIPHFEKMLYDNALLILSYLEAFQITGKSLYRSVAEETINYILRELTGEEGGFYCGQDADSEGVEGKYYALTRAEVLSVLGQKDGQDFCSFFRITEDGNFEGKNIPNLIGQEEWKNDHIKDLCEKLLRYRISRTSLHRDDKILTSWNSLMIMALAKAAFICREPSWLEAAEKAQQFLERNLTASQNRLYVRYRDGEAAYPGCLDDYAYYALALLELYQTTWEPAYLDKAIRIGRQMTALFSDSENGGFYLYGRDSEQLISRPKETYDGALPSGNSAAALVLSFLAALTGERDWLEERDRQMYFMADAASHYPSGYCFALTAMCRVLYPSSELICVSARDTVPEELNSLLRKHFFPNLTVLFLSPRTQEQLARLAPFTAHYSTPESGARYYLCRGNTCRECSENLLTALLETP